MPLSMYINVFSIILPLLFIGGILILYFYALIEMIKCEDSKLGRIICYGFICFGIFLMPIIVRNDYSEIFSHRTPDGSGTVEQFIILCTFAYYLFADFIACLILFD